MYTEEQKKGIEIFCKNPYWKELFDNAPSDNAKEYYAQQFAYSKRLSTGEEDEKLTIAIFKKLSAADWDYIIGNCNNNMGRSGLRKCREKYETK